MGFFPFYSSVQVCTCFVHVLLVLLLLLHLSLNSSSAFHDCHSKMSPNIDPPDNLFAGDPSELLFDPPGSVHITEELWFRYSDNQRPIVQQYLWSHRFGNGQYGEVWVCWELNHNRREVVGHPCFNLPFYWHTYAHHPPAVPCVHLIPPTTSYRSCKTQQSLHREMNLLHRRNLPASFHTPLTDKLGSPEQKILKKITIMTKYCHGCIVRLEAIDDKLNEQIYIISIVSFVFACMPFFLTSSLHWPSFMTHFILNCRQPLAVMGPCVCLPLESVTHTLFVVMEYLSGGEINGGMNRTSLYWWSISVDLFAVMLFLVSSIMRQTSPLPYPCTHHSPSFTVHYQRFIHCNIKLGNLLWTGDHQMVKITDYSVSHFLYTQHLIQMTPFYLMILTCQSVLAPHPFWLLRSLQSVRVQNLPPLCLHPLQAAYSCHPNQAPISTCPARFTVGNQMKLWAVMQSLLVAIDLTQIVWTFLSCVLTNPYKRMSANESQSTMPRWANVCFGLCWLLLTMHQCIRGSSPTSLSQQNHCIKPLPTRATLVTEETEKAMTAAL